MFLSFFLVFVFLTLNSQSVHGLGHLFLFIEIYSFFLHHFPVHIQKIFCVSVARHISHISKMSKQDNGDDEQPWPLFRLLCILYALHEARLVSTDAFHERALLLFLCLCECQCMRVRSRAGVRRSCKCFHS